MLRARVRATCGWTDASILNISTRGLMIHANAGALRSDKIELWHGEHVIVASVVWRKGTRAGLRTDQRIPVDDIMALSRAASLRLTAAPCWPAVERRKAPRDADRSRDSARMLQFAGVTAIAALLAIGAFAMVEQTLASPLDLVRSALERPSP